MANVIDPVILLRPCEKYFTTFFSAWRSRQVANQTLVTVC